MILDNYRVTGNLGRKVITPAMVSALKKKPIYAAKFPKAGAYTMSSVAPGFSPDNGWIMCRFVCTSVSGVNQYPIVLHDGSSINSLGLRVFATNNTPRAYLRVASADKSGSTDGSKYKNILANCVKTVAFVWRADGYQYFIADGVFDDDTVTAGRIGAGVLTTLQIGARNGGTEALSGYVAYAEIGNEFITPEQMSARMQNAPKVVISFQGQSLSSGFFESQETSSAGGRNNIHTQFATSMNTAYDNVIVNNAASGSGLIEPPTSEPENYWWVKNQKRPGPNAVTMTAGLAETGLVPDYIVWSQGEMDSSRIDDNRYSSAAEYEQNLRDYFAFLRDQYPNVQIFIGMLGRRTASYTNLLGIQKIREAQARIISDTSYVHFGYEQYDQGLYTVDGNNVHLLDTGYQACGTRLAKSILRQMGYSITGGTLGPRLVSGSRATATITVTMEHDGGTDFTPTTGIEGFVYFDGNVAGTITTFTTTSGNKSITCNKVAHGLLAGDLVDFGTTGVTVNGSLCKGQYIVATAPTADTYTFSVRNGGPTSTGTTGSGASVTTNKRIAFSSVVRASATTITATLASTPPTGNGTLYYGFDDMGAALNTANLIRDNGAGTLPLRTGKITIV